MQQNPTPKRSLRKAVKSPDAITAPPSVKAPVSTAPTQATPTHARKYEKKSNVKKYIGRTFLLIAVCLVLILYVLFSAIATVANGPSPTIRDLLVLSAMQASATKWVPGLFLPDETVAQIVADSKKINTDTVAIDDYTTSPDTVQ